MKTGLFFGSFNPIHSGHLIIANYIVENSELEELWLVVTPHNPHKKRSTLADDYDRLHLVNLAVQEHVKLFSCNIEFDMPKPSYTIDTLVRLKEKYPENDYSIIMGSDNLQNCNKWKNYEQILEDYSIYVYPRPGYEISGSHKNIHVIEGVPQMEISSSFIRKSIKEGKDISYLMPEKAWIYTDEMNFYK